MNTFDWNRARAFLVTAEEGSLSAAARALKVAQPTLGRQVAALEKELGVVLFERVGRGLVLTPTGHDLVDHIRAMAGAADRVMRTAIGQSQAIDGRISISASEVVAAFQLPEVIKILRGRFPGITVDLLATNRTSDLQKREADIAIRNFRPNQPELIAKKITDQEMGLYATPGYLATLEDAETRQGISKAIFIGFDRTDTYMEVLNKAGLTLGPENFPVVTESHVALWEMTRSGLGIGIMPTKIADRDLTVKKVLSTGMEPFFFPMWLTSHRELHTSRRVRAVFDLLAIELAKI